MLEIASNLIAIFTLINNNHVLSDDHVNYVELILNIFVKNLKLFIENKELNNRVDKKLGY